MAFLGIYGAHAVGKTTAMRRWWSDIDDIDQDITFIHADNTDAEYRYDYGVKSVKEATPGRSPWKRKAYIKHGLIRDCIADDTRLYAVESIRFDTHTGIVSSYQEYDGGAHIVLVTTNWKLLKSFIQQRCKDGSRQYNNAYWTPSKLDYESRRRYVGLAAKILRPAGVPYTIFDVDETRDWSKIDAFIWKMLDYPVGEWYK